MKKQSNYPVYVQGDKNDLVDFIKSKVAINPSDSTNKNYTLLTLTIEDCGCTKSWEDYKDLPGRSVKCEHGNYFICYKKKAVQ